jgi:hypothetical protein
MTDTLAMRPRGLASSAGAKGMYLCTGLMTIVSLLGAASGSAPVGNLEGAIAFALATALLWKFAQTIRTPFFPRVTLRRGASSTALASSYGLPARYEIAVWVIMGAVFLAAFETALYLLPSVDPKVVKLSYVAVVVAFLICAPQGVKWLRSRMRDRFSAVPQIWGDQAGLAFGGVMIPWSSIVRIRYTGARVLGSGLIRIDTRYRNIGKAAAIEAAALLEDPVTLVAAIHAEAIRRRAKLQT